MSATMVDAVRELAAPAVQQAALVLEDVTISAAGRRRVVRVVVDLPEDQRGGVPMEAVAQASQNVSAVLDASDVLGSTPYTLEVSSPGAERRLSERRHFRRALGRLVSIDLEPGRSTGPNPALGRLQVVGDDGLTLVPDAGGEPAVIAWDAVRSGRVRLDFNAPLESAPDSSADQEA